MAMGMKRKTETGSGCIALDAPDAMERSGKRNYHAFFKVEVSRQPLYN